MSVHADEAWRSRVSAKLLSIYDNPSRPSPAIGNRPTNAGVTVSPFGARLNASGWVQADIHYDCAQDAPTQALIAAGLSPGAAVKLGSLCVVEGWAAPKSLQQLAALSAVTRIELPAYVVHRYPRTTRPGQGPSAPLPRLRTNSSRPAAGTPTGIDHNGVSIMHADQFVAQTSTGGAGITLGVQSTGIASLGAIQGRGELPAVKVVDPSGGSSAAPAADEGTALLEEVHAVAPSVGLAYCGPDTFIEYTSCLGQLIAAGARILVDDVVFTDQDLLMTSASSEVQAVEQVLTDNPNVALFTAAGNYNGSYWEGSYTPLSAASVGLTTLTCAGNGTTETDRYVAEFSGGSADQLVTITQSSSVPVIFAWADPPGQNASKFDLYWFDAASGAQSGCTAPSSSSDTQISGHLSLAAGSYRLYIASPDTSSAGKLLKLWIGGDGLSSISDPTAGSIVTPQAFAQGVISVGAVNGSDGIGSKIESFSSLGPITVAFPTVTHIQAPVLVAPDGINVDATGTYFADYLFPDGNFYGTSASVPNAGASAALLWGAFPNLTYAQLLAALQKGAFQLGTSPPDGTFGYGRIDAVGALGTLPPPTITSLPNTASLMAGSSTPAYPFTVSGTGKLHFAVTSSNAAIIPATIVAAGAPGATIAPADCGGATLSCTVSFTAANGPGGSLDVTLAAVDGANRSAPASMTLAVTGNQATVTSPPPPMPAAGAGGGGGGALGWWEILMLGSCTARLAAAARRKAVRTAGSSGEQLRRHA